MMERSHRQKTRAKEEEETTEISGLEEVDQRLVPSLQRHHHHRRRHHRRDRLRQDHRPSHPILMHLRQEAMRPWKKNKLRSLIMATTIMMRR